MKISICKVLLPCLVACNQDPFIGDLAVEGSSHEETPARVVVYEDTDESSEDHPCERYETVVIPSDGVTFTFEVRLPCDRLWKFRDHGDPAPYNGQ